MNVSLSSRAQLPIKALLCICCLLPAGCATHKSEPRTPAPATKRPEPPAIALPPQPTTVTPVRPRRLEQPASPVQPAPKPASTISAPVPVAAKPVQASVQAVPATPIRTDASKPAPSKTAASNAAPSAETVTAAPPLRSTAADTETITVALGDMPISIHDQWILDRDESRCTLQSATQQMDDGQGGTRISLWLTANTLTFSTESDIDLSYTGTGITIGEQHFALETIERRTDPVFSKQRSALVGAMKTGQTLQLTLGFWPTWPVTHTYSASFPLQHFATAYAAWESCNTLLSQR